MTSGLSDYQRSLQRMRKSLVVGSMPFANTLVNGSLRGVTPTVQVIEQIWMIWTGGSDTADGYLIVDGQMYVISAAVEWCTSGQPRQWMDYCGPHRAHNADEQAEADLDRQ